MKGRNVGTIREESPKQGLTSAKDLPIELPESPYHRLDLLTNLTYSLMAPEGCCIYMQRYGRKG